MQRGSVWLDETSPWARVVAQCGEAVVCASLEGIIENCNPAATRLLGYAREELVGLPIAALLPQELRAADAAAWLRIIAGEAAPAARAGLRLDREGRLRSVSARRFVLHADDGQPLALCEILQLDEAAEAAAEGREGWHRQLLGAIVESSGEAIVSHTLEGRITHWNPAAEALFGYRADEMLGRSISTLLPPARSAEAALIDERLRAGERIASFETQRRHKAERLVDVAMTVAPMKADDGRVTGATVVLRDVGAQRRLASLREHALALEAENRQAQEASRAKSAFLANMSHELRTPMNVILGFADLLQRGSVPPGSPRYSRFLDHIVASGQHLLQLINDVLDLSKVEAGKFQFHSEPVDLPRLVQDVAALLRPAARARRVQLDATVAPGIDGLMLDGSRLRQVIYTFVSNAIKFSGDGGRIALRCLPEGGQAFRVEVEDSGPGIAQEDLPQLFSEFHEPKAADGQVIVGSGLGLSLTRRLVEAQGGTVGVRSLPGVGSTFHAVLPRIVVSEHALPPWRRLTSDRPDAPLVLVVEDNANEQALLVHALSAAGCAVEAVATVIQAVDRCRETRFDAITLDLLLPDGSGLEALRVIRSGVLNREVPVLVVSVVSEARDTLRAFPVHDVLVKPVTTARLLASLRAAGLIETASRSVLLVVADESAAGAAADALRSLGCEVTHRRDAAAALDELESICPAVVVLDPQGAAVEAAAFVARLRAGAAGARAVFVVWSSGMLDEPLKAELQRHAQAVLDPHDGEAASADDLAKTISLWLPAMQGTVRVAESRG